MKFLTLLDTLNSTIAAKSTAALIATFLQPPPNVSPNPF